ncbi:ABC transporter permease [Solemya pervernicosa gill symbiont]|uniref:Transport permease protein n=2 Tax=Gammaproteobacteria incertae sedis TaxID=118884 RepID=A0A1T2L8H3_9GAMM|nr:ABC transporter permease [Candidatus Reidiella endopervernicosa]OOZ41418.1 ABC transporter permease [Solemya pervernicosa gill symbiont]QKQ27544.1 ABC transporter permease [Candidatus Reidiella endopervernicosa]
MNSRSYTVAFMTLVRKEMRRFFRIWPQTILPPIITTSLYFVIFGTLIGSQISPIDGSTYMEYIAPGIILMSIISNSYANVVSSFYGSKFQRFIEEVLIAPIPAWVILLGYISGGVARGLTVGLVVAIIASLFTDFPMHNIAVTLIVAVLTAVLFSLGGFINAVYAKSFDDISIIPTFVLTPLTYLGGIFYSIEMLPPIWRDLSLFNPILYMINATRYGMLGISDIDIVTAFAIIIAFIVALFSFSLYLLKRGVGIRN